MDTGPEPHALTGPVLGQPEHLAPDQEGLTATATIVASTSSVCPATVPRDRVQQGNGNDHSASEGSGEAREYRPEEEADAWCRSDCGKRVQTPTVTGTDELSTAGHVPATAR